MNARLLAVVFACWAWATGVQAECRSDAIDAWYRANDAAELRAHLDELAGHPDQDFADRYLAAYGSYRLAELAVAVQDKDAARDALDTGIDLIEKDVDEESLALLSMLYGMKAGLSGFKAMFIGPKSSDAAEKALEIDAEHPRAVVADGLRLFYTPGAFGGDREKAAEVLDGAVALFADGNGQRGEICWGEDTALLYQGLSYASVDELALAAQAFETVLERHPDHHWARLRLAQLTD